MDKQHILDTIRRLAIANNGKAPGRSLFERETAIKMSDWYPHLWLRWGDALVEAGYVANQLQTAISDEVLLKKYIDLTRELAHLPVEGEIRRKARTDKSFPSHSSFHRFGERKNYLKHSSVTAMSILIMKTLSRFARIAETHRSAKKVKVAAPSRRLSRALCIS
jgi:hypothetical protein